MSNWGSGDSRGVKGWHIVLFLLAGLFLPWVSCGWPFNV